MKGKKVQIILGAVAVILAAAIVFTTIVIVNSYSTKTVIKKVTTKGEVITEHVDEEFDNFLDDIIGDTTFDDDFWDDLMGEEEIPEEEAPEEEAPKEETPPDEVVDDMDWINGDNSSGSDDEDKVYTSKIQKNGTEVSGNNREINIKLNEVAYEDYWGLGGNTFPEVLSDDAIVQGYDSVRWEFDRHKYIQSKMGYTRTIISIDAMITNDEPNPSRDDIENNKDYQNYINGIYSWDNDSMASLWENLDAFATAGTKVMLNTGWKAHSRIQKWYSAHTQYPQGSAPYDIKSFVKANAYWLVEAESRYPGLIVSMCFGNEVSKQGQGWMDDFNTHDDYIQYNLTLYSIMQQAVEYIKETGLKASNGKLYNAKNSEGLKNFQLTGADQSYSYGRPSLDDMQYALDKLMGEDFLGYAKHYYYRQEKVDDGRMIGYDLLFDQYSKWNTLLSKPVMIHEMRAESPDKDWVEGDPEGNLQNDFDGNFDWQLTYASYCILSANTGCKLINNWDYGAAYYPNPNPQGIKSHKFVTGNGQLFTLGEQNGQARIATNYYFVSLFQNYVPAHSDVLMVDWTGEDVRVSAFKLPDGNYTFVVEVNEGDANRNIKLNFDKALGFDRLYRYTFTNEHGRGEEFENKTYHGSDFNLNGAVIQSDGRATLSADKKSATDTVGKGYAVYIYSTKGNVKNVTLEKVVQDVVLEETKTVDFNATTNDDGTWENAEIKWTVLASAKETGKTRQEKDSAPKGSIDANGTYTIGAGAQPGEKIAIAAYIDDNGNGKFDRKTETTYALGVVYIR